MDWRGLLIAPLLLFSLSFAAGVDLVFSPSSLSLGTLQQGEELAVEAELINKGRKTIQLIDCIAQGRGPQEISYPKQLRPGERGKLTFLYRSSGLEGQIVEHITLINKEEETYPLPLVATVVAPVTLWPAIVDFGWIGKEKQSVQLYAFSPIAEQFDLSYHRPQLDSLFEAVITPVRLDISQFPEVIEESPNGRFGYRITLTLNPSRWPAARKSLGALAQFHSLTFPRATPEFYAVGYRK